jgi:hypothetical protein
VLFLGCIAGVIAVRFWLFPPESLSDRARLAAVAASVATMVLCFALTASFMRSGAGAMGRAREQARKEREARDAAVQRILDRERDDLGAAGVRR